MLRIASAGSTLFGVRDAAGLLSTEDAKPGFSIATDHGHLLLGHALAGLLEADIVLLPFDMITELERAGRSITDSRVDLGSVNIGAAVRSGHTRHDVSTKDALIQALQRADEIVLTLAPTGQHMMQVIQTLGLEQQVTRKIRRFDKSVDVNAHIAAADEKALAFGPATEIIAWREKNVDWCGPIPPDYQISLPYAAAILTCCADVTAARKFVTYLTHPAARQCFAETGVAN